MKRIIGAVCLLVLFVAYQTSITAFTHVHYVNGVIITHSHPFHGKHTHSKLGLSICKLTVEKWGGEIWVDPGYTDGARFVFTHPLDIEQPKK